jgi:hypothetical protein
MAPTDSTRMSDTLIPLGEMIIVSGPGRYEFLIEGLNARGVGDAHWSLRFGLRHRDRNKIHFVTIRVTGARHLPSSDCPVLPAEIGQRILDHDMQWQDAWEFTGYCPGYSVPVRGIFSTRSRRGVAFLWLAHVDTYTCACCRHDLHRFFMDADVRTAMLALERAKGHMYRGSIVGELTVRCEECFRLFRELRRSCELP